MEAMFGFGKKKGQSHEESDQEETQSPLSSSQEAPATVESEATLAPPAAPPAEEEREKRGFFSRFTSSKPEEPSSQNEPESEDGVALEEGLKETTTEPPKKGLFGRLRERLTRTRESLGDGLGDLLLGKKEIDDELLEELETRLLMADVGIEATQQILDELPSRLRRRESGDPEALMKALKEGMLELLTPCEAPLEIDAQPPYVILMVGINGAGKTTTIGKLAKQLQQQGKSVMLAAGDTFRAAAVEQLQEWGRRNEIPVVAQQTGADSASVLYDAVESARAKRADVLIADTAGRLHTQSNLMEELKKVKRVMQKLDAQIPHEVMLILDAGTGQNGVHQAQQFHEAVGVTGITLTKLDGTAKGGIIFAISKQLGLPIRLIGVGEGINDLRPFAAEEFVEAILS
jgi:fused signal recognition particle receptor